MRAVELAGYSVLRLTYNGKGELEHAISESLIEGLLDEDGTLLFIQTARGREPAVGPIVGRDGEVTFNGSIWPDAETFLNWAAENTQ